MKKILLATAVAILASSVGAQAAVLFSDDFQTSISASKWAIPGSAQIVAAPVGGGNAMNFANQGSGGDLFSQIIAGTGAGHYSIKFDYFSRTPGGGGAFIGLYPTGTTTTVPNATAFDDWMGTDSPASYPTAFTFSSGAGFTTVNLSFDVTTATPWGLKLEDFVGAGGSAGDAYFRNLTVSSVDVPEPLTLSLFGAGLAGMAGLRRRRKAKAA